MELKKIHISDIGKVVTGKTPRTSVVENYGGDIPFLTPSDDLSHKSAPKTTKTLTEQGLNEVKNCLLPSCSVCVSCIGSDLGKVVMTIEPTVTNQQFNSIIPNKDFNADFVYYLMTLVGRELNYLSKTSTAVPIINKSSFSNYEIEVPDLETQKKIASFLSSLDDKIELNRRINDNLEAMAKQLYDYWFVQFDFPNEEGKPYKSSGGEMVWNEKLKRMIPKEWTNANIYQLASISKETVNPLARPNELFKHYSLPEYDKTGTYAEEYGIDIQSAKFTVTNNCILVSKLNPWTSRVICGNRESNQICSTEFVVWNPASMKTKGFLFMLAKSAKFIEYCTQGATGTSHSHRRINPELMMKFDFSYNSEIAIKFSRLIENIIGKLHDNIAQLKVLTKQRGELLPLLMNGQITIE